VNILTRNARTKEVFTILPGHQPRIAVTISDFPGPENYMFEPVEFSSDGKVTESASYKAKEYYAPIMNVGISPVKIQTGTLLRKVKPLVDRKHSIAVSNAAKLSTIAKKHSRRLSRRWTSTLTSLRISQNDFNTSYNDTSRFRLRR
jgi:hypothetical protein